MAAATCETCSHADEHGWWGPDHRGLTHCRGCHGSWPTGTDIQHCLGCHRTFTNIRSADMHHARGTWACQDPDTVRDKNGRRKLALSQRQRGPGTTVTIWALADDREPFGANRSSASDGPQAPIGAADREIGVPEGL